ncbi:U-scoloptoxin(01)-Cw1a [Procambarus clarkii]|uniref:U-scoloptoxin(01)-Cw1a n=1 Tax=Procambarus clarkii TaxID=6728 RepID=UPI001E675423|nr:U-scoloptoxin(01)-Cw1a-like [Procambarus clarkii]
MRILLASLVVVVTAGTVATQEVLPFLKAVPDTTFSCEERPYGYYADVEADCQAFHICLNDLKWSFLCPNQTLFNQEYFVCDHAINVDCSVATTFYSLNDNFGKVDDTTETATE